MQNEHNSQLLRPYDPVSFLYNVNELSKRESKKIILFKIESIRITELCKSKPQWGTTSHQSEWLRSKNLQAINAGEGVEKREPSYTVGGNAN